MNARATWIACLCAASLAPASGRAHAQDLPASTPTAPAPSTVPALPTELTASAAASPREASDIELGGLEVQPGGLTAKETEKRALARSSSLGVKRAELQAANAKVAQTTIQFFPQLTVRANYTRLSPVVTTFGGGGGSALGARNPGFVKTGACPPGESGTCVVDEAGEPITAVQGQSSIRIPENNFGLGAGLTIPISDYIFRISDAAAGASASRSAARLAAQAEERKVRSEARLLYYNWLRTHGQVNIAHKAVERTQARLADAQAAFDVGTLSRADLMRVQALVANAQLAERQAVTARSLAEAQLAIVMSDATGAPYRVGESVPALDAPDVDVDGGRRLIAEALARRLELKSLDESIRALSHGEDAVRVGSRPRLDAVGDVTYGHPNSRFFPPQEKWDGSWSVGLVLSWNIDELFLSDARGDELAANAAAVSAQREGVAGMIANEVATAQMAVTNAHAALAAGATSIGAAEESYRVTTDLFRVGRATTSDLIDAESDLLNARLAIFNARVDLTTAVIRLDHAVGRDTTGP